MTDDTGHDDDTGRDGDAGPDGSTESEQEPTGPDDPSSEEDPPADDSGPGGPSNDEPPPRGSDTAGTDDPDRRWLIRIMVAVAIGLPIAIEFRTLVGLVERAFGGGGDGGDAGTTTGAPGGVRVGDDLLPATGETERVADAFVSTGDRRTFTLAVSVENAGDRPYRLRVGDLRTGSGTVSGSTSTDPVQPGGSTSLVARWTLPEGATPQEVRVEGEYLGDGTVVETVGEWVRLGNVPVR